LDNVDVDMTWSFTDLENISVVHGDNGSLNSEACSHTNLSLITGLLVITNNNNNNRLLLRH